MVLSSCAAFGEEFAGRGAAVREGRIVGADDDVAGVPRRAG
jgi:hypothetical protein